jgi:hypothetical protein
MRLSNDDERNDALILFWYDDDELVNVIEVDDEVEPLKREQR